MSRKLTIHLAALLTILALSVPSAHAQFFRAYEPVYLPGGFYGGGGYPGMGYGGNMSYGGSMSYNASVYTPDLYYSGYSSGYSAPIILGSESSTNGRRSSLAQATKVAHDSPLLLAGHDFPTGDNRCAVVVVVPEGNAKVWFQGSQTNLTGRVRRFTTPALEPNQKYEYDILVQWNEDGKLQSEPRTVQVHAGGVVNVLFANSAPSKTK